VRGKELQQLVPTSVLRVETHGLVHRAIAEDELEHRAQLLVVEGVFVGCAKSLANAKRPAGRCVSHNRTVQARSRIGQTRPEARGRLGRD